MIDKSYNKRQQLQIFQNNGFKVTRVTGSHRVLRNESGQTIVISAHGNKMSDTAFDKTVKMFQLNTVL